MNIKSIVKKTIENWIDGEMENDPRFCMSMLFEPVRPTTEPEEIEE